MTWNAPFQLRVTSPELRLDYELSGPHPVQGVGTIGSRAFYFHAKHSQWTFEAANDLGEFPSDVGGNSVFLVESRHNDASNMPSDEAKLIVEKCTRLFIEVTETRLRVLGA